MRSLIILWGALGLLTLPHRLCDAQDKVGLVCPLWDMGDGTTLYYAELAVNSNCNNLEPVYYWHPTQNTIACPWDICIRDFEILIAVKRAEAAFGFDAPLREKIPAGDPAGYLKSKIPASKKRLPSDAQSPVWSPNFGTSMIAIGQPVQIRVGNNAPVLVQPIALGINSRNAQLDRFLPAEPPNAGRRMNSQADMEGIKLLAMEIEGTVTGRGLPATISPKSKYQATFRHQGQVYTALSMTAFAP